MRKKQFLHRDLKKRIFYSNIDILEILAKTIFINWNNALFLEILKRLYHSNLKKKSYASKCLYLADMDKKRFFHYDLNECPFPRYVKTYGIKKSFPKWYHKNVTFLKMLIFRSYVIFSVKTLFSRKKNVIFFDMLIFLKI